MFLLEYFKLITCEILLITVFGKQQFDNFINYEIKDTNMSRRMKFIDII